MTLPTAALHESEAADGSEPSDAQLAVNLARSAGDALLEVRARLLQSGADATKVKSEGDRVAQVVLAGMLAGQRPRDAVLSEEAADDLSRLTADRVWIIDPLDGTREFSEVGRTDWAVHVALWVSGELTAGAVTLPAAGVAYGTEQPFPVPAWQGGPLRLAVSRSRPPRLVDHLAAHLGAELVPMGSAGVKVTSLLRGDADAYVHAGGQFEWDSAAPVAVARAAGLHTSRIDGRPLVYNREDPRLPDLLVCRVEHAQQLLDAIAAATDDEGVAS